MFCRLASPVNFEQQPVSYPSTSSGFGRFHVGTRDKADGDLHSTEIVPLHRREVREQIYNALIKLPGRPAIWNSDSLTGCCQVLSSLESIPTTDTVQQTIAAPRLLSVSRLAHLSLVGPLT